MSVNNAISAPQMGADSKPVLAIDFGTTHTYVTTCPGNLEAPVGVEFGGGGDGIATAILYRDDKEPLIGHTALEEFGEASAAERKKYRLHAQFKPDLVSSAEARLNARNFLVGLLALARRLHKDIEPLQRQVIFGVPSEASAIYRETLRTIAQEAGFGDVKTVDEPKGALYFHLHHQDITPSEALNGALVVDFGGGTCDFAFVENGKILHSWGDMRLGGRLFDDLFYQWFIEQNPKSVARMRREGAEFFVQEVICREAKEKFSLAMALDRTAVQSKTIGNFGRISEMTWNRFLERASRYRPSPTFAQYLHAKNPSAGAYLDSFPRGLDLIDWFRQTLRQGLTHARVRRQDPACVILTGGSSAWNFVADTIKEELGSDRRVDPCQEQQPLQHPPRLMQSAKPYITVSQGLAIVPALQRRLAATQSNLRHELPAFIRTHITPLIEKRMDEAARRIAELVAVGLFDERLQPTLLRFRREGGSVANLKARIAEDTAAFRPRIEAIVTTQLANVLLGVAEDTSALMQGWYHQHRLIINQKLTHAGTPVNMAAGLRLPVPDVYGEVAKVFQALGTTIISVLAATVSGGAGTALIMSGPIGLLIGALIGLIISTLALRHGLDGAKRRAEQWEGAPSWLIARALPETKMARLRDDLKTQIKDMITAQMKQAKKELEHQIGERVEQDIANLSTINQLC